MKHRGRQSGANPVSWPLSLALVFASLEAVSPGRCALIKSQTMIYRLVCSQTSGSKHTRGETRVKRGFVVMIRNLSVDEVGELIVVENFFEELKAKVGN